MNRGETVAMASVNHKRKIVSALCKFLSLNSVKFMLLILPSLCLISISVDACVFLGSETLAMLV